VLEDDIAESVRSWEWDLVARAMRGVGDQLNSRIYRMMKGEVFSIAIEKASRGDARYVDEEGYDFLYRGLRIELKTEKKMFRQSTTADIQLKNTRGSNQVFKKTFDILLIVQSAPPYLAAIADWDLVNQFHRLDGDQIKSKIPIDQLTMVTPVSGVRFSPLNDENPQLRSEFEKTIRDWIDSLSEEE